MNRRCGDLREKMVESLTAGLSTEEQTEIDRHVAECSACREYGEALRSDDERLAGLAASTGSSIHRIESSVMNALDQGPCAGRVVDLPARRLRMSPKILQIAAAVAVVLAAVWALSRYTGLFKGSTPAFAAVLEKIEKARSVIYRESTTIEDAEPFTTEVMIGENGVMRSVMGEQIVINDFNRGIGLTLMPSRKEAFIVHRVGLPRKRPLFNYLDWIRDVHKDSGTFLRRETIDGRQANVFLVEISEYTKMTIWADGETDLPMRIEESMVPNPDVKMVVPELCLRLSDFGGSEEIARTITIWGGHGQQKKMDVVYDDFRWNAPLDAALLSLTPPEGYTVREWRFGVANRGEKDLTEALATWAAMSGGSYPSRIEDLTDSNLVRPMLKGKFDRNGDPYKEFDRALQEGQKLLKGLSFAQEMKAQGEWSYDADGVRLGDADKPICRWKLKDSQTYRVVYGDLSIRDLESSAVRRLR